MKKFYRKKQIAVEAIQFTEENVKEVLKFSLGVIPESNIIRLRNGKVFKLRVPTLEGNMVASLGDYIIRGVEGEIYPCKASIFEKTYEEIKG